MSATQTILKKIFRNPEQELIFFDDISVIDIYKKEAGRFYLKSLSNGNEERLVYNEKTGKSAPEEIVRQLFLSKLIKHYKYPKERIEIEKNVNFGREQKRADIVVYLPDKITPKIIIEAKAPNEENDIQQLKSYLNAEGAPVGVGINGKDRLIQWQENARQKALYTH
ncbi:MAG: hypothetical protein YFSK_2100 [Candidatus Yanofskyibacterium parasiticum]|nr:MAG: hypothetical protein YFSK_2100 [Candidatus Yanofskybacteria bacterium]